MLSAVWSKAGCSWGVLACCLLCGVKQGRRVSACCLLCGVKQGAVDECWHVVYCVE